MPNNRKNPNAKQWKNPVKVKLLVRSVEEGISPLRKIYERSVEEGIAPS